MNSRRYPSIVLVLIAVYTVIVLSPLAPLALKSPTLAHAITGQCSGNCDICGCSPERRATHTCCCWMKKKRTQQARVKSSLSRCSVEREADCCPSENTEQKKVHCCEKQPTVEQESLQTVEYRCCPCGTGNIFLFPGTESYQHLPFLFSENLSDPSGSTDANQQPGVLISCYQEPPDPPPKISLLS